MRPVARSLLQQRDKVTRCNVKHRIIVILITAVGALAQRIAGAGRRTFNTRANSKRRLRLHFDNFSTNIDMVA